ncbi:MAG: diaminopimelate decarboxylase [Burkholderiaceae bacterium]|nr:diaminopimelate decarboxylase [Burkholderiaceae bacterium]
MNQESAFRYREHSLFAEDVALADIAREHGTPAYVYSRSAIETAFASFVQACRGRDALVCFALKANSNLAIIELLARAGAGFDIVSGGELQRVVAAGGDPSKVLFSGVGKSEAEMRCALDAGVRCFNVESESELLRLDRVAASRKLRAPVSLRVNPDVDAGTHPYISTGLRENKFGIAHEDALDVYRRAAALANIEVKGIACHIGSQITSVDPYLAAADKLLELVDALHADGIELHHIDFGGGLGIRYRDEDPPSAQALLEALFRRLDRHPRGSRYGVFFEFGRSIVGNAGVLLTRVEYLKQNGERRFAIVDAAMNDLMRPALYEAYHGVLPVRQRDDVEARRYDVVGPVCESGDWLARDRSLAIEEGDLLAIASAGAYGMAMASNYNTRPRAVELLVDGAQVQVVRERESVASLFALERRLR